ncbi:cupin domain-containing protein [Candidatus Solirubrobacter pratensis]|jgi:mannose-6-phosphate isomerase-like protein (cupin superfamily)|uniref:cupin domain-containing protein n=1 Tax=Candidatus Solirubrobacter pratensis TaxID=1298857 RepID=UPI0004029892|nr:cupin domain-containing protein [Candidatus Solirubrobacter pratensis]
MAHIGQTLDNPVSGETITFVSTAAETDGELLAFDLELTPDGKVPGLHVHPEQTECFRVVEGTMTFKLGRKTIVAQAGDIVTVPPGAAHKFANGGETVARARVEVRPALQMAELLETAVRLAEEGRTLPSGMPRPLALAQFTRRFRREVRGAFPPAWVQQATMAPLALIARKPLPAV